MAEGDRESEPRVEHAEPEKLTDEKLQLHISNIDSKFKSPEVRALEVVEYLKKSNFTTWDICCFCVNWLGTMSIIWPWLLEPTKVLAGLVYRAHYFFTDQIISEEKKL